jgi:hypothetical protein
VPHDLGYLLNRLLDGTTQRELGLVPPESAAAAAAAMMVKAVMKESASKHRFDHTHTPTPIPPHNRGMRRVKRNIMQLLPTN